MMRFFAIYLAALASCALAIQITFPSDNAIWTTGGPNNFNFIAVNTDPLAFQLLLVTPTQFETQLSPVVYTNVSNIVLTAPSGGFPAGQGWRVRLRTVIGSQSTGILAESGSFSIISGGATTPVTGGTTISASLATPPTTTAVNPAATPLSKKSRSSSSGAQSNVHTASAALLGLASAVYAVLYVL